MNLDTGKKKYPRVVWACARLLAHGEGHSLESYIQALPSQNSVTQGRFLDFLRTAFLFVKWDEMVTLTVLLQGCHQNDIQLTVVT